MEYSLDWFIAHCKIFVSVKCSGKEFWKNYICTYGFCEIVKLLFLNLLLECT